MEDNFKIFLDKDLKIPAGDPISFGKLKAGHSKKFIFYIYNSSVYPYEELTFSIVNNNELFIISVPEEMKEKSKAEIVLEWKPKITIRQGLKAKLKIEGYEVIS